MQNNVKMLTNLIYQYYFSLYIDITKDKAEDIVMDISLNENKKYILDLHRKEMIGTVENMAFHSMGTIIRKYIKDISDMRKLMDKLNKLSFSDIMELLFNAKYKYAEIYRNLRNFNISDNSVLIQYIESNNHSIDFCILTRFREFSNIIKNYDLLLHKHDFEKLIFDNAFTLYLIYLSDKNLFIKDNV